MAFAYSPHQKPSAMTVDNILDKVTHSCCGNLGLGKDEDDAKPEDSIVDEKKTDEKSNEVADEPQKQEQAPPKKSKLCTGTGKDTKYEEVMWDDLPKEASEAAAVLGFDKESWDSNAWLDIQDYRWEDMSEGQVAAATALGWDIDSWNDKYEEKSWADIPENVKSAAEKLGFTQEMWDDDEWPEDIKHKDYDDLTKDQQVLVAVLGYTKIDWDES